MPDPKKTNPMKRQTRTFEAQSSSQVEHIHLAEMRDSETFQDQLEARKAVRQPSPTQPELVKKLIEFFESM